MQRVSDYRLQVRSPFCDLLYVDGDEQSVDEIIAMSQFMQDIFDLALASITGNQLPMIQFTNRQTHTP